ncbi:MAG: hypothetical protein ACRD10_15240, partial [Terriglobia bacterium]
DRKAGMASNFDCCLCQCGNSYISLALAPVTPATAPGQSFSLVATAHYLDHCGDSYFCVVIPTAWYSSASSVASVSGGTVTGHAGGTATITANYSDYVTSISGNVCHDTMTLKVGSDTVTVQVPSRLVRYSTACAPNGFGTLQTPTDGNFVDCLGNIKASGACGVGKSFSYQLVDQYGKTFQAAYTIYEFFSTYSSTTPNLKGPPGQTSASAGAGGPPVYDIQAVWYNYPSCLGSNDHQSYDQTFSVYVNGQPYSLSTVVAISDGRFSGTLEVNSSITTP